MLTVTTAPTLSRKLVKSTQHTRRQLHSASRDEEAGCENDREAHTIKFNNSVDAAYNAIVATYARAADFSRAAAIHAGARRLAPIGKSSRLALCAALLGQSPPEASSP
ncbi:hypothetical protein AB9F26_05975 [Falsihalocynthiibacter sp. BN13B15]|uniref:hypothetical protein n=1 Tax=Falsihalocynthiibacter sp. BN13B15 TaxID=3240871 RepID=UPI00350F2EFC